MITDDLVARLRLEKRELTWRAADEIERLRAEVERLCRSRNRWGKKYNDCLAKLRLAVFSDTEYVKEIETRAEAAERKVEALREALRPFANPPLYVFDADRKWVPIQTTDHWIGGGFATTDDYHRARAALKETETRND